MSTLKNFTAAKTAGTAATEDLLSYFGTLGKGLSYEWSICILKEVYEHWGSLYQLYIPFLISVRDERSQGDFYGLSGLLGLSTVRIMSTSKAPPNAPALDVGKCPRKILLTVQQTEVPPRDRTQILPEPRNKPVLPQQLEQGDHPGPRGLPETGWGPNCTTLCWSSLNILYKYIIWLKNCLVKIKFKSPRRSM